MENGGGTAAEQRKVMVVADPTRESAAALQYVLSHVVLENDTLYLLHVENPTFWKNTLSLFKKQSLTAGEGGSRGGGGGGGGGGNGGDVDFLDQMKRACELMQPKIKVYVSKVEMVAKDKATAIMSQTEVHGIDLLVIGKRQSLSNAILGQRRRNGSLRGVETAEYLIENSKCTCVAVQRKGQTGGYLLHTKTHRNFWLLA